MIKAPHIEVQYINCRGERFESLEAFLLANGIICFDVDQISEGVSNFEFALLWEWCRGCILEDEDGYHPTGFLMENFIRFTDANEMYLLLHEGLRFYFSGLITVTIYRAEILRGVA